VTKNFIPGKIWKRENIHNEKNCEHGNEPSGSIKCWEILE
jgi:hypothetical protein